MRQKGLHPFVARVSTLQQAAISYPSAKAAVGVSQGGRSPSRLKEQLAKPIFSAP
jgi:hypothetical protein